MGMITVDEYLYIVGGTSGGNVRRWIQDNKILKSVDGKDWEETEHKLKLPRTLFTVISTSNLCE